MSNRPADSTDTAARLEAAMAFLGREFRRNVTLADVARVAHFSEFHFQRLFRRRYGKSPKRVLIELRVAEVQRLLLAGTPGGDAARATGFSHASHMISRFKEVVGLTPRRWLTAVRTMSTHPAFVTPDVSRAVAGGGGSATAATGKAPAPLVQRVLRILVVEDDPDGREILLRLLTGAGHEVHAAADGPAALASAAAHRPDVVLADIGLPGMDGCELLKTLRGRHGTPGVALTAFADEAQRCRAAGFARFLTKPAHLAEVLEAVTTAAGPA